MKEIWKDIKGYIGFYQVSNMGNIRPVERFEELIATAIIKKRRRNAKAMATPDKGNGYLFVRLCKNGQ